MKYISIIILSFIPLKAMFAQQTPSVGGNCEGCEAIYEHEFSSLNNTDTLPDFERPGKSILLHGVVRHLDGRPASDVIVYIYHTDQNGVYPTRSGSKGWEQRHGFLRGWIKTDADGRYAFYTKKPAAYPGRTEPAHIHVTVKEPGIIPYYLDSYRFEDDPLLTDGMKSQFSNFGGSGIVTLDKGENIYYAERDLILGRNIKNYPK